MSSAHIPDLHAAAPTDDGKGEYIDGRMPWWRYTLESNLERFGARVDGLSSQEAQRRLSIYGRNRFLDLPSSNMGLEIARKFLNPLALLLLFAAVISATVGDTISAVIIVVMVLFSVLLGFIQEYRAGQAAQKVKQSSALRTVVRRDGALAEIDVDGVVPGDIVVLRAGQLVPADGRVLSAGDLSVTQAARSAWRTNTSSSTGCRQSRISDRSTYCAPTRPAP